MRAAMRQRRLPFKQPGRHHHAQRRLALDAPLQGIGINFVYYVGIGTGGTNLGSTAPRNAGTYTVLATFPGSTDYATASNSTSFTISSVSLTITAVASSNIYDGTTAAAAVPAITSGPLMPGDTAGFTETYSEQECRNGLTLTPSKVVNDGNRAENPTRTRMLDLRQARLPPRAFSITAAANARRTTVIELRSGAAMVPAITSGTLMPGDTAGFTEAYSGARMVRNRLDADAQRCGERRQLGRELHSHVRASRPRLVQSRRARSPSPR